MSLGKEMAEEVLVIDNRLRYTLFGLECALGISFSTAECERVFHDATCDQVFAKNYVFFASSKHAVTGRVDEYEPDSIWIQLKGIPGSAELLRRVIDGAKFLDLHLRQVRSSELDSGRSDGGLAGHTD